MPAFFLVLEINVEVNTHTKKYDLKRRYSCSWGSFNWVDGQQVGVVSKNEALRKAADADLDLVLLSPNAKPPVARIMDYGKFRFEQQKKAKENRKNQKVMAVKEIRLSPTIEGNDFDTVKACS